jgi:hypothetical protein
MTLPTKPDLVISDLLKELPRTIHINVADIHPGSLTLMEALDIMDASGIDSTQFESILNRGTMRDKARLLYAMAWVIARRIEPDLTYAEVCAYHLEIHGTPRDDATEDKKAKAIMGVATLAQISPAEAKKMTLAEVSALVEYKTPRKRVSVGRRRRAS